MLKLKVDGPAEHAFFYVLADPLEVIDAVAVAHRSYVLSDDGPFVKVRSNVVAGSSDEFNATGEGAMIRTGTFKCR